MSIMRAAFSHHQRVRGLADPTVRRRDWTLAQLEALGPLAEHTPDSIEEFLARWENPTTRYALHADLLAFYRWAVRRGRLTSNPAADVDPPRIPTRLATPVSRDDISRVIAVANHDQFVAIMCAIYAGLRCSEIAALDMGDVHRDRQILVVRNGKGARDAILPLAPELAAVLPRRGPAVPYETGVAVGRAIRRAYRRAGVVARPHDLRATFGTAVARRSGGNMVLTARLLRHASLQTSQRYVRWLPDGAEVVAGLHDPDVA